MKKLSIFLALCIIVTAFSACKSKKVELSGDEMPVPTPDVNGGQLSTDSEDTDSDVTDTPDKNPELELDDVPVPVEKGITGRVTEGSINVRETAGTDGKAVTTAKKGQEFLITELQGVDSTVWGRMEEGYVCLDYVSFDMDRNGTIIEGIITADNLSVREAPHVFCEILDKAPKNTRFEVSAFACSGTAVWGLTPAGWISLEYVQLDHGVEVVAGENAEKLDPFFLAPDYKEVVPSSDESVAPSAESVVGIWEFATLTSYYSTIYEEYFSAVKGYLSLNEDGSFTCGYDDFVSILYSQELSVSSWDVSKVGKSELGGTYEVAEDGIVLNYTYSKATEGDEVVTEMSKTVTLQLSQKDGMLFVKNPSDIVYSTDKNAEKIKHGVFYRDFGEGLLEAIYPGTYY